MRSKLMQFSNFSRALETSSTCYRFDKETQIPPLLKTISPEKNGFLVRGSGLSYGDCCMNHQGIIFDMSRLNHLISFDEKTAIAICQSGVTFADLFLVHNEYIPPVIPGTLYATLGGGIANDIHGKNNTQKGSLAQHIDWIDLQIGEKIVRCSKQENSELFFATLGGLGLTGLIKRVALKLQKSPRVLKVYKEKPANEDILLQRLYEVSQKYEYQVAWMDMLNPNHSLLSYANPTSESINTIPTSSSLVMPRLPFRLLYPWTIRLFNQCYYKQASLSPTWQSIEQFNNPLDKIKQWNYFYGKKGLLQFQAVFDRNNAPSILKRLREIIRTHKATPTLSVLKYFTKSSPGLLAFSQPGFTIAIDFLNSATAIAAILQMNQLITEQQGKVYLAKDLFLTPQQFKQQYPNYKCFRDVVTSYSLLMQSNLSRRLEIFE